VPFQACSSGQRQRLAIARALIHEPDLLLFDEPERSLDAPTRAAFAAHLRKIAIEDGRIVVVAGHELGDLEGPGSRRVRLRDGRVEADEGPTAAHPLPARERGNAARPLPGALRALRALARRDRLVFLSYRSQVGLRLGLVTAWILILYYVSQLVDTASPKVAPYLAGDYFSFALLGLAFLRIAQVSLVQMASALREEQLQGTVEPLFATGTKPILLVIGGLLWPLSSEMAGIALVFGTGALVLGAHAADPAVPALLVASAATIVATAVWGVLSVAFVVAFQRGDPVALLVNLITIGLSGAYFPVEMVPAWLRPVSSVLPLRWGLDAIRAAALRGEGFGSPAYRRALANLAFLAAILLPVALWSFGAAVRRARRRGTLAQS